MSVLKSNVNRHSRRLSVRVTVDRPAGALLFLGLLVVSSATVGAASFGAFWFADVKGAKDMWPVFLIFLILGLIGGGLLLGAINMARRRAVLAVAGDRLLVRQTGVFGGKRGEWRRDQIEDMRIGPSRMSVGQLESRPVFELQIQARQEPKLGLLAGRHPAELAWMATVLRRALQLSSPTKERLAERGQDSNRTSGID